MTSCYALLTFGQIESQFKMYSELVYSSSVRFSLAGEETNSVWNLVSLWVHGWVASDWYKYPEYWAQPKHPRKADILHSTFKRNKVTNVTTCFQQSLPTQDAFLSHCFIGSLDTSMNVAAWRRLGKLKSHSGGQKSDWALVSWVATAGTSQVSLSSKLVVLNRISCVVKKGFVLTEKLVDKVAASLILNLPQGRKTLSSKISEAVKFIRNQDNFSKYLQQIKVIVLFIRKVLL